MKKEITTITIFDAVVVLKNRFTNEDYTETKSFDSRVQAQTYVDSQNGLNGVSSEIIERQVEPKFFAHYAYSDINPYEVVRIISDNTIEVRAMKTDFNFSECEFVKGGFSAVCVNPSAQTVKITSHENWPVERIRRTKKGWMRGRHTKFGLTETPKARYDVNF